MPSQDEDVNVVSVSDNYTNDMAKLENSLSTRVDIYSLMCWDKYSSWVFVAVRF